MLNTLATSLLHIAEAQKIPKTIKESILSVAILLTDLSDRSLATDISTAVNELLLGASGRLWPIINKLEELTVEFNDLLKHISTAVKKLDSESSSNIVEKIIMAITSRSSANPPTAPQPTSNNRTLFPSYTAALAACVTKPVNIQFSLLAKCDL